MKLPSLFCPYWCRNEVIAEEESLVGKRRLYYDSEKEETTVCSESEDEEEDRDDHDFSGRDDAVIWWVEGKEIEHNVQNHLLPSWALCGYVLCGLPPRMQQEKVATSAFNRPLLLSIGCRSVMQQWGSHRDAAMSELAVRLKCSLDQLQVRVSLARGTVLAACEERLS